MNTSPEAPIAPTRGPLLTVEVAATYLGVSDHFMRRLARERRIPFHKLGRFVRFDPADLDEFVAAGRVEVQRAF